MEFPTSHRVPVSWLKAHACAPIRWRTLAEILPADSATPEDVEELRGKVLSYKGITQIARRQAASGIWASSILAIPKSPDARDAGTVFQYRRMIEMGADPDARPIRLANRVFFRLLSRDPDPKLGFEFQKDAKSDADLAAWARERMREAGAAALAQAGHEDDPRVRGAAQRVTSSVSQFMRSELSEDPIVKVKGKNVLHPSATPPTLHTVALTAQMPALQRERAGFVERLVQYLIRPAPLKSFVVQVGSKTFKPSVELLGDPLHLDAAGRPKDLPFGLYWIETLARLGVIEFFPTAKRALIRLMGDCDEAGVWSPKGLRGIPKSASKLADFAFPLEVDVKDPERRKTDVTFRLSLIAKLLGCSLTYT